MSKYIVLSVVLTAALLTNFGCEQSKASATKTTPPPAAVTVQQPATTPAAIEPNKVEVKPEPARIEQPVQPESPKIEQPVQPEPNMQAAPAVEPTAQETKPAEPNIQPAATPKSAQADTDAVKVQPAASKTATQLCDKCTEFLKKYVNQDGMVDYKTLSRKKMEMTKLLEQFRKLDRNEYNSWSNDDKLAFWLNSYNLELIKIIMDNYPIESNRMLRLFWPPNSIRHISGIWDEHKFIIMEEEFTLRAIDQRYFQNEFSDPRVFLAISYASVSGTPLRNAAYSGENLSAQLDDQVKKFLAGPNALKIDRENRTVSLSSILNPTWYGGQFVAKYGTDLKFKQQEPAVRAVFNFLSKYISPQDTSYLETGNYKVEYLRYDWTLNENGG
jgi:hypothetical protein